MLFKYSLKHLDLSVIHTKENLLNMLKDHDFDSFLFSVRMATISYAIAKEMKLSRDEIRKHYLCGVFHDVGKLGMSHDFINYPHSYTIQMYEEMKNHPAGGAELLLAVKGPQYLIDNCRYHHCNYDGSGYPGGKLKEEIPIYARMTRISDSIDAYLTKRCYKDGGPANEVLDDLMQYRGSSYDPELLDYFAVVHNRVMQLCHEKGFDHPSQHVYMHFLNVLYEPDVDVPFLDELLQ